MNTDAVVSLELDVDTWLDKKTGVWVGWCPALDIYSQGVDMREAVCATIDAVKLHVKHSAIANRRASSVGRAPDL